MSMNLVIDVGNTLVKLAVFETNILQIKKTLIKKDFLRILNEIQETFPNITQGIVSAVSNLSDHQLKKLQNSVPVIALKQSTKVPFINKYASPDTLGVDRIALVSAAASQYPNKNILVIDMGTCITYDFLNEANEYLGGGISPGIDMRYKAVHTFTENLPLIDANHTKELIGNTTATSIHSGIINGVLFELDGFISQYKKKFSDLTVILTGGDIHFLRDNIKNDIFANSNFLLEGLNHILEYNKH